MKTPDKKKYWSQEITDKGHSVELEEGVFTWKDPKKIAKSLMKSAMTNPSSKGMPFQSAMSMLNFYINRAGKNLNENQKKILEAAKKELRKLF